MSVEIKTSIIINAPIEKVWQQFIAFENLLKWSSFLKKVVGDLKVGNKIKVEVDNMKFTPKILVYNPLVEFKWKGKILIPKLFDGTHQFLLKDNLDGSTTFHQNEKFEGLFVVFMKNKLRNDITPQFEKMNLDLKKYIEK